MSSTSSPKPVQLGPSGSPGSVRYVVLGLSAVTLVSALGVGGWSLTGSPPAWFLFAFECVVAIAAVFGIFIGLDYYKHGRAIGTLTIAGAVLASSVFESFSVNHAFEGQSLKPLLLARFVLCIGLVLCAGWLAIRHHAASSLRMLLRSAILVLPVGVVGGVLYTLNNTGTLASIPVSIRFMIVALAGLVLLVFFAASVHMAIKAFSPSAPGR